MSAAMNVIKAVRVIRAWLYYRARGVRVAGMPYVRGHLPRISTGGEITVGRGFRVDGLQHRLSFGADRGGRLEIGEKVFFNRGVNVHASQSVIIGSHTRLADMVTVSDSDFHEVEHEREVRVAPVTIGRNVWIGRGAIVLPGVTVGDHAVIGAGSVVRADVEPRTLVAGNPARVVREELRAPDGWVRR